MPELSSVAFAANFSTKSGTAEIGQFGPESVVTFNRNQWSVSAGISGQLGPEYAIQAIIRKSLPSSVYRYPSFIITLYPFLCTITSGAITLHEHASMRWMQADELITIDWAEADVPVLEYYLSLCSSKTR